MNELDPKELDPGIMNLVMALRASGWNTTDSGDGVSKRNPESPNYQPDALPFRHVVIRLDADDLGIADWLSSHVVAMHFVERAQLLQQQLDNYETNGGWAVELTYWPCDPRNAVLFASQCAMDGDVYDPVSGNLIATAVTRCP